MGDPSVCWTQLILFQLVNTKNITPLPRYSVFKPFAEPTSSQVWSHNVCLCFAVFTGDTCKPTQRRPKRMPTNQRRSAASRWRPRTSEEEGDESWSEMNLTACAFFIWYLFIKYVFFLLLQYYVNHVTSKWLHPLYAPIISSTFKKCPSCPVPLFAFKVLLLSIQTCVGC